MKKRTQVICFGEVLWDVVGDKKLIGGAPLNVCYHLSQHAIPSKIISQVGGDADGEELKKCIERLDVDGSLITTTTSYPSSKVLVVIDKYGHAGYDIVKEVAWDYLLFNKTVAQEIAEADCFVYGSLVARNKISAATLFRYLNYAKWKVLDVNLRAPHYDRAILEHLLKTCNTLKINDNELAIIGELFLPAHQHTDKMLSSLLVMFPNITEIIVTKGAEGAVYYSPSEHIAVAGVKVNVIDTIGSGDSFLAAYIASKLKGNNTIDNLQKAVQLSAFVATQQGACPPYPIANI